VIGGFEFAAWSARRVRFVMQADVGKPSAQALVGEQKEQRYVNAVGRQAVNVAAAVSLRQRLAFQLAQIVTELVESIIFGRELESGEEGRGRAVLQFPWRSSLGRGLKRRSWGLRGIPPFAKCAKDGAPGRRTHIRFFSVGSRLCFALPSDPASRRYTCASLTVDLRQVG